MPVDRDSVMARLARLKPSLEERFGVRELAVFGSVARGEAGADSDVDILVHFEGPATSRRFFGVLFDLEDALGCRVDLVTEKALRPELRPFIAREAIRV